MRRIAVGAAACLAVAGCGGDGDRAARTDRGPGPTIVADGPSVPTSLRERCEALARAKGLESGDGRYRGEPFRGRCSARAITGGRGGPVVLGQVGFLKNAVGWGRPHPAKLSGGGDPELLITHIRWRHWGAARTSGVGRTAVVRFTGGYYPGLHPAILRAWRIGRCRPDGPRTYLRLEVRVPPPGGTRPGRWFDWSGPNGLCVHP